MLKELARAARVMGRRKLPEQPSFTELAQDNQESVTSWWPGGPKTMINPDVLVQQNGDYSPYKEMANSPIPWLAINHLSSRVIGQKCEVICKDQEIADFCEESIEIHMGWAKLRVALTDWFQWAAICGFDLAEPLWDFDSKGSAFCYAIKPKDPDNVTFEVDSFYNIKNIVFRQGRTSVETNLPRPDKFMLLAFQKGKYGPYGKSMLKTAYASYRAWLSILKSAILYGERGARPTVIGFKPPGLAASECTAIGNMFSQMYRRAWALIRNDVSLVPMNLDAMQPGHFTELLDARAREMLSGILGGFLNITEGSKSASRSAGDLHDDNIEKNADAVRSIVEDSVSQYLLFDLARYEFGIERVVKTPPYLKMISGPSQSILELSTMDCNYLDRGIDLGKAWRVNVLGLNDEMTIGPNPAIAQLQAPPVPLLEDGKTTVSERQRQKTRYVKKQTRSDQALGMR